MLRVVRGHDRRSWGLLAGRSRRRIDPNRVWQAFKAWRPLHKALGMGGVGRQARAMTKVEDRGRPAVVHIGRREIAQPAVMVPVVVPGEEIPAHAPAVFEGAEPIGNSGRYLKVRNWASENGLSLLTRGRE